MARTRTRTKTECSVDCGRGHNQLHAKANYLFCIIFFLGALLAPPANSFGQEIEQDMQNDFVQSKSLVEKISAKQSRDESVRDEMAQIKAKAESVKASRLLLEERFALRENSLKQLGGVALERHRTMVTGYRQALTEFLSLIESIPPEDEISPETLERLNTLLESILTTQQLPVIGSLPYRHQSFPSAEPLSTPVIIPAYKNDSDAATLADLASTPEAPITKEIAELAQSLGWNPASIYEYVKNNVETEWYWGCMKGAEETLRQKSGNDCDQATLLVALMRAAGFPSRYVRGVIELPDAEQLKNLTGTSDAASSADLLAKAGIPNKKLLAGGSVAGLQVEHIWVESLVPYLNYRGAVVDGRGKVWLGLDTSIKAGGYTYNAAVDAISGLSLADFRDKYLEAEQTETPLVLLRSQVETNLGTNFPPGKSYSDALLTRTLNKEVMNILPASMQYEEVVITGEYAQIPEALKHRVRITASENAQHELFSITLDAGALSSQQVIISYEPETVDDQRIIDLHGGLNLTPAYLVHLRPVLKVDGERIIVGQDGLAMGKSYDLSIEFISPKGSEQITNKQICGNMTALGIVSQKAVQPAPVEAANKDAERLLHEEAINYIERWNRAEEELAALLHISAARPMPTFLTVGGVVDVTYLMDMPHDFKVKGLCVDASLRIIEVSPSAREKDFMSISALQGSVLEERIFKDDFQVEAISTAKLLGMVGLSQLITINKDNIATALPTLTLSESVKADISSAVNQNYTVRVPASEITYQQWTGSGYIKENPATGEAGYMLSGMIAGGMTAWRWDYWPDYYASRLKNSYAERPNTDPASGAIIQKLVSSDLQFGKVGEKLGNALQVMVKDKNGQPVQNAEVMFMVVAGGGTLNGGGSTIKVSTNLDGIASVELRLGRYMKDNPTYLWGDGYTYHQQIGENVVNAVLVDSGTSIPRPFSAYGLPKAPHHIKKLYGDNTTRPILHLQMFALRVEDEYNNPISNEKVSFEVMGAEEMESCDNPNQDSRSAYLMMRTDACMSGIPTWDDCSLKRPLMELFSSENGVNAGAMLGGWPGARYTIKVKVGSLSDAFTFYTQQFGNCKNKTLPDGGIEQNDPMVMLYFSYNLPVDNNGDSINAAKVNTSIPVQVKYYVLKEGETRITEKMECPMPVRPLAPDPADRNTCTKIVGSRSYSIVTDIIDPQVTIDGNPAVSLGSGLYKGDYTIPGTPQLNTVPIHGGGEIIVTRDINSCQNLCAIITDISVPFNKNTNVAVYGVDIIDMHISGTVYLDPQDPYGYSQNNLVVDYKIAPDDYKASNAYVILYKDGTEISAVQAENTGTGTATFLKGMKFERGSTYEVEVLLNSGTGVEISSKKILVPVMDLDGTRNFSLVRSYNLSQFDAPVELAATGYFDSYQTLTFFLEKPADVTVKIVDPKFEEKNPEKSILIPSQTLTAGEHKFLVDYYMAEQAGFTNGWSPEFYVLLKIKPTDGSAEWTIPYHGSLWERKDGKMLGQTMVHDVMLQDGSLNLSRQDLALEGRGPQLAFSRTYNNQSPKEGYLPLGEGWSHNLDMKLRLHGAGAEPSWVEELRGKFYTKTEERKDVGGETAQVNGTTFRKHEGVWYHERGRHGSLVENTGYMDERFPSEETKVSNFIYISKDGTKYFYPFALEYKVQKIEDRNGNAMTFEYDGQGRPSIVTDATGRSLYFTYATSYPYRLTKVTGPDNIELVFTYNNKDNLESASRGERIERYAYEAEPWPSGLEYNLVRTIDANAHSYIYSYYGKDDLKVNDPLKPYFKQFKSQDVVKTVTYPDGKVASFTYEFQEPNRRVVKDLRGNDTAYTLNYHGNPIKIEEPLGKVTQMTWSINEGKPDNVMTSRTNSLNYKTFFEYDTRGNVAKETDPYNNTIITVWNEFSLPLERTDRNNIKETWAYDPKNGINLLTHTDGDNKSTTYTYYDTGEVQTMTDPRGNTTTYTYDAYGNPDKVIAPKDGIGTPDNITDNDYDIRGRKTAVTNPLNRKTEYFYDNLDRLLQVTYPEITSYTLPAGSGRSETKTYDNLGNLLTETDRIGQTLTYTYTPRNQVETVTSNMGGTKTNTYDANGNLLTETDWKGAPITHTYNALNQRESTKNRLGYTMYMGYDTEGNLTSTTDYEGKVTTNIYDKLNRLEETIQPALEGQTAGRIVNTYYKEADPKKNLKTVTDQENKVTEYRYNGRYLLTQQINILNGEPVISIKDYDDNGNLSTETDAENKVTTFKYDALNRQTSVVETLDGREIKIEYKYDLAGNRTHVIDPLTRDTETVYDEWNRAWKTIVVDMDPASNSLKPIVESVIYDGKGNKVSETNGRNYTRYWNRDAKGRVKNSVDAEGKSTKYTYDLNDNVETVTDALDTVTKTTYDAEDRPRTITEALNTSDTRTKTFVTRDKLGNPLEVWDFNGNVLFTKYNALYLPWRVYDPAPINTSANYTETTYYKTGKVKTVKNRRGYTTQHEYDDLWREIKVTDPLNQTIETTYDKAGNVKTVKDKRGIITENFYDDLYRLTETKRDGVRLVTNVYDNAGNKTATIDANDNRIEYVYNNRNLLITTTYPDNNTEKRTYDAAGNLQTETDEEIKVTTYTYDKENRNTSVERAGETTYTAYDAIGNVISIKKPRGNIRAMEYDRLKRLKKVIDDKDGGNLVTRYEYDKNGNLRYQYDARNNVVEYVYDSLNRKTDHIQHKFTGNLVTHFVYDAEGNLLETKDAKGQVFKYVYDELNRLKTETFPALTDTIYIKTNSIGMLYDANNNVKEITEKKTAADGTNITDVTSNEYDNFDRLKSSTERGVTVSYDYDANGNRKLVETSNGTTTYTFNNRNRIETAKAGEALTTYTYYPDGKQDTVIYANDASVKYTYWPTDRVKTVENKAADGTVISSYAYEYDTNGNRTKQIEVQDGVKEETSYVYDTIDRMTSFTVKGASDTTTTEYTFEGYNRKTEKVTKGGVITADKTYYYDRTDWLLKVEDNANSKILNYSYDNNGNTLQKTNNLDANETFVFDYDQKNRLTRVKRGLSGSETVLGLYDYNSGNLRVRHRNSERGDVDYFYDDDAVIEEHKAADNSLLAHYRYADRLLSLTGASVGSEQFYHYDGLGSTVNLTNTSGTTEVSYNLDPWGHIKSQSGDSTNRMIFTGQEHDENTGLIYFGARYYDADTARFITQDSYLGEPGTPPSLNRYLYAYSNPTVYVDLAGYSSEEHWYDSWRNSVNNTAGYLKDVMDRDLDDPVAATTNKTIIDFVSGALTAPIAVGEELGKVGKLIYDDKRSMNDIPFLGSTGKAIGETYAEYYENPNLETFGKFAGALGAGILTPYAAAKLHTEPKINGEPSTKARVVRAESLIGGANEHPGVVAARAKFALHDLRLEKLRKFYTARVKTGLRARATELEAKRAAWIEKLKAEGKFKEAYAFEGTHNYGSDFRAYASALKKGIIQMEPTWQRGLVGSGSYTPGDGYYSLHMRNICEDAKVLKQSSSKPYKDVLAEHTTAIAAHESDHALVQKLDDYLNPTHQGHEQQSALTTMAYSKTYRRLLSKVYEGDARVKGPVSLVRTDINVVYDYLPPAPKGWNPIPKRGGMNLPEDVVPYPLRSYE